MREVKDKEGSEQKEIMDEISDLDALLPDLDAKVVLPKNIFSLHVKNKKITLNTTLFF